MDRRFPSSLHAPDELLDEIAHKAAEAGTLLGWLEHCVLSSAVYRDESRDTLRRYLYLYTVPVVEAVCGNTMERISLGLAEAQLAFGVHLRHLDDVIDGDCDGPATPQLDRARRLFSHATLKLEQSGVPWSEFLDATYRQFLLYDMESRKGWRHQYGSFWRRVSPLCVVAEAVLPYEFRSLFQKYLAWSLLQADCDDAQKDIQSGCTTPVTRILIENQASSRKDYKIGAGIIERVQSFSKMQANLIRPELAAHYPLWSIIFTTLERHFES